MNIVKKFLTALWSIFKTNVVANKDAIHEQIAKDVKKAVEEVKR